MDKIYYGSGSCTIETNEIVAIQISYRGNMKIEDKTQHSHTLMANERMIMIFPLSKIEPLSELFEYSGEFKITSVMASNADAKRVSVQIKRVLDFPELMDTNAEDLTMESERLNAGHTYKNKVKKTTVNEKTINDLHSDGELYLEDKPFRGAYHIHKATGQPMTGSSHTQNSVNLQVKKLKDKKWRINK